MRQYADIVVYDKNGQLALIAEVKNKQGTSKEWAAKMRRNMYAHGFMPNAPFFLLALPDHFYLWKNPTGTGEEIEPTQQIDPAPFLQPYFEKAGVSPGTVTGKSFELIVGSWLNQILRANRPEDIQNHGQDWLLHSGLFEALAGGYLKFETAA
jgi:hypothetical protein